MAETCWVWCGPDKPPEKKRPENQRLISLNTFPSNSNVNLILENISIPLASNLSDLVLDILEVGSYVYAADQTVTRGGKTLRDNGSDWRRSFEFDIPVRCLELWNRADVKEALESTLNFMSDENFQFRFRKLRKIVQLNPYFKMDEGRPWFSADQVLLFSGGLDSLAGLCKSTVEEGKRVIAVSHRAAPQVDKRQRALLDEFSRSTGSVYDILHIPIWVNKQKELTRDTNQRTRSFLFAMMAAAIAQLQGMSEIRFYENGITSCNLSLLEQLKGARASRTTHPGVLKKLSQLLSLLVDRPFAVVNPFFWKTKADIVQTVIDAGLSELIARSVSCSRVRPADKIKSHCGVCSQCVGRRLATLATQAGENDPDEIYQSLLPTDPLGTLDARTTAESYVRFAKEVKGMGIDDFYHRFGPAWDIITALDLSSSEAAQRLFELHQRHSQQVVGVLTREIELNAEQIADGRLHPDSLLAMVVGQNSGPKETVKIPALFPTPPGAKWENLTIEMLTLDSVRIRLGTTTKVYTGFDMGFRDGRKNNMLNKQWDLLWTFAEAEGKLDWANEQAELGKYKPIYDLNQTLKRFFGLSGNPIHSYRRGVGYVTRFKITARTLPKV